MFYWISTVPISKRKHKISKNGAQFCLKNLEMEKNGHIL